ncbi:MAG: PhzF family phenazine biosynthesis protein [Burkholderiales bacterium]|nr:PhzF family phenazine biosynthesis protein [Burkholderiales bacterium]
MTTHHLPTQRPFKQVDVFTATPYYGNPLAVVLDGSGLTDAQMQHFAHWTNLSETTFVLPPTPEGAAKGADYRVRIFTPGAELPFAGHPTLGSCHAWLQAGGKPRAKGHIVQECGVGLVQIRHDGGQLAFAAPTLTRSAPSPSQLALIAQALGLKSQQIIAAQMLDNGPIWLGLLLDSVQAVLGLQPDHLALKNLGVKVGVVAVEEAPEAPPALIARSNREARAFVHTEAPSVEVRAFAAPVGVIEDPVTGSLNASLAQWLMADGYAPTAYTASQGTCLDRAGRVQLSRDASGQVWVGGESVTCVDGSVTL